MDAAPIGPGDYVECVDDSASSWGTATTLIRGKVYVVTSVFLVPAGHLDSGGVGFTVHGTDPGTNEIGEPCMGFKSCRFVPVYKRDVKRVRDAKFAANIAGLRAYVDAEARARFDATMSAIEGLGSSQSHPVPGRHRAARNLKLSTHGGAK